MVPETGRTQWSWGYVYAAVAIAAFLAAVLGGLHLYRALESAKEQFLKRAALSAQVFAESALAAGTTGIGGDGEALRQVTRRSSAGTSSTPRSSGRAPYELRSGWKRRWNSISP